MRLNQYLEDFLTESIKVRQSYYETDSFEFFKNLRRMGINQVVINIQENCETCSKVNDFSERVADQIFYAKLFNFTLHIHRFKTFPGFTSDDCTEIIIDDIVFLNCGHANK